MVGSGQSSLANDAESTGNKSRTGPRSNDGLHGKQVLTGRCWEYQETPRMQEWQKCLAQARGLEESPSFSFRAWEAHGGPNTKSRRHQDKQRSREPSPRLSSPCPPETLSV